MTGIERFGKMQHDLLLSVAQAIENDGVCIVSEVLDSPEVDAIIVDTFQAQEAIESQIGVERLVRAREHGVVRCPMTFSQSFMQLLANPTAVAIAESLISNTCILHLQNAFALPSLNSLQEQHETAFQLNFHRDFPRFLNGYTASINCFFVLTEFTQETGATQFLIGSHQRPDDWHPKASSIKPVSASALAGDLVVFDSTIWHSAGKNVSPNPRLAVNHQYTRSWIRQQIDYTRAVGRQEVLLLDETTQRLLGAWVQVPASLDEFYVPQNQRLYRAGQG